VVAPASPLSQLNRPAKRSHPKSRGPAAEDTDRYRMHVVATNITDVVTSIGGLIFDRAMAGWDVTVEVDPNTGTQADRAIRILGGRVAVAEPGDPQPDVLAVATDVFVTREPVRRLALAARNGSAADVLLWGRRWPPKLNRDLVAVRHRPSAAAQVFKSHALGTRGAVAAELADEGFYSMA
jgi:hypothetical protein